MEGPTRPDDMDRFDAAEANEETARSAVEQVWP